MIKAYLVGIPSLYEGEDIEVRFSIYEDGVLLNKKTVLREYEKPAAVGLFALQTILDELKSKKWEKIEIIVNDQGLGEFIRETTTTKNIEILRIAKQTRKEMAKFDSVVVTDVSRDFAQLSKWDEELKA